jgi:hypothetical protein
MARFLSLIVVVVIAVVSSVLVDRYALKIGSKIAEYVANPTPKNVETNAYLSGASADPTAGPTSRVMEATAAPKSVVNTSISLEIGSSTRSNNTVKIPDSSETALCPELHRAIQFIAELPTSPPELNISILQLVGSWDDNYTSGIMQTVFDHNAHMVSKHFGFGSKAVTNLTECMSRIETSHPAFCKILAVRDYCVESNNDLVWFLDGDVVLMNPTVRIDYLWFYYQQHHSYTELDMLFATDWLGLNSGSFVVNCTSPTALRLLAYWDIFAPRANRWKNVWNAMLEQNGIQWLVQDENWRRTYPRHKRDNKLLRSSSEEEKHLFSASELRKRVAVMNQTCQVATFPVDFWCDSQQKRGFYEHKGPVWWEVGHGAVHTAGTRDAARRLPYLLQRVQEYASLETEKVSPLDIRATARLFLERFGSSTSVNPLASLNAQQCKRDQRHADQEAKEKLEAKLKTNSTS